MCQLDLEVADFVQRAVRTRGARAHFSRSKLLCGVAPRGVLFSRSGTSLFFQEACRTRCRRHRYRPLLSDALHVATLRVWKCLESLTFVITGEQRWPSKWTSYFLWLWASQTTLTAFSVARRMIIKYTEGIFTEVDLSRWLYTSLQAGCILHHLTTSGDESFYF